MSFGVPLLVSALGGFLYGRVDVLFIHAWLSPRETADYYFMFSVFDFPLRALGAHVFVLGTEVAHSLGRADGPRIRRLFWRSERFGLGLGVALATLFFASTFVIPLILPEYEGAMELMRLAAPLLVIKCMAQIASGAFLVSLGRPSAMAAFTVAGGVLNVVLDVWLIRSYGVKGAVYSTLLGHSLMGLLSLGYVAGTLRERPAGAAGTAA